MAEARRLIGFPPSIYTWVARFTMAELGLDWTDEAVDPFADPKPERLLSLNPAGRVPVLIEGDFVLCETGVICRHLARQSPLVPGAPDVRARMEEIIAVMDADGYRPMVRQVYGQSVFGPAHGRPCDSEIVEQGLARSQVVLQRLEEWLSGDYLVGAAQSLADCHAAPMVHALGRADEGAALLGSFPAVGRWLELQRVRPAFAATRPAPPA